MLCMSLSWAFATFFLLPVLSSIGPEGNNDICPGGVSLSCAHVVQTAADPPVPERPIAQDGAVEAVSAAAIAPIAVVRDVTV